MSAFFKPSKPGEIVSESKQGDGILAPFRVVLHQSHKPGEWVVHTENLQVGGFSYGCYHNNWGDAWVEYLNRCESKLLRPVA